MDVVVAAVVALPDPRHPHESLLGFVSSYSLSSCLTMGRLPSGSARDFALKHGDPKGPGGLYHSPP